MREERKLGSRVRWGKERQCVRTRKQAKECHHIFFCVTMFFCVSLTRRVIGKNTLEVSGLTRKLHLIAYCMMLTKNHPKTKDENVLLEMKEIFTLALLFCFVFLWGLRLCFAVIMRSITGKKSLQIEHFQIPYSHPIEISPFSSLCEIMQWIAAQKKGPWYGDVGWN